MSALLQTYDSCYADPKTREGRVPLVPLYHTTNNMHVTVTIDGNGKFCGAEVVPKDNQNTIIPCTESSAGRTFAPSPHPLDDKLIYLAKELSDHLAEKPSSRFSDSNNLYMKQLREWCESDFSNEKVETVYKYLQGATLIEDLIKTGVLTANSDGILLPKKDAPDAPLFSIGGLASKTQYEAFIRWAVDDGSRCIETWLDNDVADAWIGYCNDSSSESRGLCYLTGDIDAALAENHPNKLRNTADKAKIISSNDSSGFTYRGRFDSPEQAYGVGSEATQKVHSALRWLIGRQGWHSGDLCIVAWGMNDRDVLNPAEGLYAPPDWDKPDAFTNVQAAKAINKKLSGYRSRILDEKVCLIVLDSAVSGKGRLSVSMFREELGQEYLDRLESWQTSCAWTHRYVRVKDENGKDVKVTFVGAPSPKDIAFATYGANVDDKIVSGVVKRILPCILDGERVPRDITDTLIRRASNPVSMERREWSKVLSIACSVYKNYTGGIYEMTLETERRTRDYLYGRLLALADLIEERALGLAGEKRQTNAVRLMQRFSEYPYSTWMNIELSLVPYAARLGSRAGYYQRKIAEVMDMFDGDDFRNNSKLSGEFLLAYHCQREDQFKKKTEEEEE